MAEVDVTRIAGNIGAMNSLNSLANINKRLAVHQTRLATGKRINSAADDPAGLTIATKMFSRSEGLKQALSNIGDAKNLLAVAESGLGRINDILVQMRNKAEAAASDTMGTEERDAIKVQLSAFAAQVDDIVKQTSWNSKKLIDGNTGDLRFQTGAESEDATIMTEIRDVSAGALGIATVAATSTTNVDSVGAAVVGASTSGGNTLFAGMQELDSGTYTIAINLGTVTSGNSTADSEIQLLRNGVPVNVDANGADGGLVSQKLTFAYDTDSTKAIDFGNGLEVTLASGLTTGVKDGGTVGYTKAGSYSVAATSATDFANYMETVQTALNTVNGEMAKVGALTGRLSFKEDQISAAQINTEAAYNRIMNANMAEEQVEASKYQILQQTATAMLAQANAAPQFLLSLFR